MVEQRGWFDGAPGLIHLVLNFSYFGRAGSEAIKIDSENVSHL